MLFRTLCAALAAVSLCHLAQAADKSDFASQTIDLGIVVGDAAKSVKFYTEAIGFTEAKGFKVDGAYAEKAGLSDNGEELDIHVLTLGDGPGATKLKLMAFKTQPKSNDTEVVNSRLDYRYLTIFVNDMNAAMERLKKAGAKPFANSPQNLPKGLPQDVYLTVLRDPDGNIVELVGPKK